MPLPNPPRLLALCGLAIVAACATAAEPTPAPRPAEVAAPQLLNDYTITFRNFSTREIFVTLDHIKAAAPERTSIGDHEGSRVAWRQNLRSPLNSSELTIVLFDALIEQGLSESSFRITAREQGAIEVAKLGLIRR